MRMTKRALRSRSLAAAMLMQSDNVSRKISVYSGACTYVVCMYNRSSGLIRLIINRNDTTQYKLKSYKISEKSQTD